MLLFIFLLILLPYYHFQLLLADIIFGLRMSVEEERLGADECAHGISSWRPMIENQKNDNVEETIAGHLNEACLHSEEDFGRAMQLDVERFNREMRDLETETRQEESYIVNDCEVEVNQPSCL